jgi:hypothetical protein
MRGRGRNLKGKGGGATKVIREGENINRPRGGRGTSGPSIGSLLSRGATKREAVKHDLDAAKCTDAPNLLPPNTSFFGNKLDDIEYLLNDLNTVGTGSLTDQHLEVEMRLLTETDPSNLGRFTRVLRWLQSFEVFEVVQPLNFEEKTYVVPASSFREGYTTNYIIRTATNQQPNNDDTRYLKVKKLYNGKLFVPLPSAQICPRLGISLEATNFNFDITNQEESTTFRRRWKFPIDSNTLTQLTVDKGQDIVSADSINYNASRIEGLPYVRTDVARGSIDLTETELPNRSMLYSIEIELDPTTITAVATERQVSIFGGREVATTARDVKFLTLSEAQLHLLDSWAKVLITVITKNAIFMTNSERQSIEESFNASLGLNKLFKSIPSEIVNQPTDLHKHDLSWLSPEKSDMFMQLANYDQPDAANVDFLVTQGLFKPLFSVAGGYYVSPKADGTRYYLYLAATGIYLVNPLSNTLTMIAGPKTDAPFVRNILAGTILDTEVIGDIEPDGTLDTYQILVFDILALEGVDVRPKTYTERLQLIEGVIAKLNDLNFVSAVVRKNEAEASKAERYIRPVVVKSFSELLKIQAKPVYKLPSLDDIPAVDPATGQALTATDRVLYSRALAREFFRIFGAVARASYYSSANLTEITIRNPDGTTRTAKPIPQNTKGILWYTDGDILTPASRPYLEVDVKKNFRFSMVKKWKPIMTIDFRVRRDASGKLNLLSGANKGQGEVPFAGGRYPWNGQAELTEDMDGKIIEFQWVNDSSTLPTETTISGGAFVALRERPDKLFPNNLKTATDVWTLINDPITLDDLEGTTMMLMGRYHNRVKNYALADIAQNIQTTVKVLLDLGSGRGGDISKWHRFKRVYAVEPDIENLREFITRKDQREQFDYGSIPNSNTSTDGHYNRMRNLHARSRVLPTQGSTTTNAGGAQARTTAAGSISNDVLAGASKRIIKAPSQETQSSTYARSRQGEDQASRIITINLPAQDINGLLTKVPLDKVNAVTMFNALTFFYENLAKLQGMINTVKTFLRVGGYFYVLAMDGELLLNFMGEHNTITTANIEISKSPDVSCRKIWIKSKVGIVRGQYEYLIHLREFVQIMTDQGFKLLDERYLDEELLLTDEEYWFSSLFKLLKFSYGIRPASSVSNTEIESNKNLSNQIKPNLTKKEELLNILRPLVMENSKVIPPLEPYEAPQIIRSTILTARGVTGLLRYGNPQDGSAYLHAILRAFSKPYNALNLAEKQGFIIQLRKDLAERYTPEVHNRIDGGRLRQSPVPALQYENLREALGDAASPITQHMLEFINEQLQVNVVVLRGIDAQPYQFSDVRLVHKPGLKNIVLYWINDSHFETVGQLEANNFVKLVFDENSPLLQ